MEITLHTEGWYDSAHFLNDYVGKCSNMHGHTYLIRVWVRGGEEQLDKAGILWDFGNLKKLLNNLDHKNLNDLDIFKNKNSTAENQAIIYYKLLKKENPNLKFKLRVYEQINPKKSYAEVGDW